MNKREREKGRKRKSERVDKKERKRQRYRGEAFFCEEVASFSSL